MDEKMDEKLTHIIPAPILRQLMADIFEAIDVSREETSIVLDALMEASLAGYDSHGVMRVARYVEGVKEGTIVAGAAFRVLSQTVSVAHVDAGFGFGPVTATKAVELACQKATDTGIGCVSVKNSNDIGRLGSYLWKPARAGLVALLMVNDSGGFPAVAPFGATGRFFSTNPLGAGIPTGGEPIVIDISSSVTSVGSLRMAANRGQSVPDGWLIDTQGKSVTDPDRYFSDPDNVTLLPLGGLLAGHKGFALQMLIDALAGGLSGAGVSNGMGPDDEANAIFALAIDPDHFISRPIFFGMIDQMVSGLKTASPLPGVETVLVPGERAAQERKQREKDGVPMDDVTRLELATIVADLGLTERYVEALR